MAIAPVLSLALTAIGTGIGIFGAIQQGQSQQKAAEYQAGVAEKNKQINLLNATRALDRSKTEELQVEEQNRALYGAQVAQQSASGLALGGRSQILTRKSARELGRRDALNVLEAGEIEAYNFRVAAEDSGTEAQFLHQSGQDAALAGWLNAGSTLIGGLTSPRFAVPGTPSLTATKPYTPKYLGRPSSGY